MVGVLRPRCLKPWPTAVGWPSDQPRAGLWQKAQLSISEPDSRVSKNSARPSSMRAALGALPSVCGTAAGRSQPAAAAARAADVASFAAGGVVTLVHAATKAAATTKAGIARIWSLQEFWG